METKSKWLIAVLVILIVVGLGIGGIFVWRKYFQPKSKTGPVKTGAALPLDPQKEATHLSKVMDTKGVYWVRGLPFVWNDIEHQKGKFNWEKADEKINEMPGGEEVYHLAMLWPYANWDQDACHEGEKYRATGHLKESGEDLKLGAPCDVKAYGDFVEKVVERYDGDGQDDMPGLVIPIKYWEIMNEPEMQGGSIGGAGEELKFFVGTPEEYLEILKTSYQAIKKADPKAKVAHAGMAGLQDNFKGFWLSLIHI